MGNPRNRSRAKKRRSYVHLDNSKSESKTESIRSKKITRKYENTDTSQENEENYFILINFKIYTKRNVCWISLS